MMQPWDPLFVYLIILMTVLTSVFAQQMQEVTGEGDSRDLHCEHQPSDGTNYNRGRDAEELETQRKLAFLEEYNVNSMAHNVGEESLMEHLQGVSVILKDWGLPSHVQDAGLFHSVFGTANFELQAVPDTNRPVVRDLIGVEAEALTWAFGNLGTRQDCYDLVKKLLAAKQNATVEDDEAFVLPCTVKGDSERAKANRETLASGSQKCELRVSRKQVPELAAITLANELEGAPRHSLPERRAWAKDEIRFQLYLFRPLLPEKACSLVEQYLEMDSDD